MKRVRGTEQPDERPAKVRRVAAVDRLSKLSDELLVRILSFGTVSTLLTVQRVSKKFGRIAIDSELWKAAYYNQFVLPRASRLSGIRNAKDAGASEYLRYSSKLSKWLDDGHLVKRGQKTNWKHQYRLRYNWARGKCAVSEIVVAERPPEPPLLVMMQNGLVFTADSISGLRVWNSKDERELIASTALVERGTATARLPTSMAVDSPADARTSQKVVVGFEDGSFVIYALEKGDGRLHPLFHHPPSSNGMLSAVAYSSPYLLTMTEDHIVSLYSFSGQDPASSGLLDPPKLLYSLRSHTAWPPVSLSLRTNAASMTASIAYALPTYLSGWTVGIQEMRLSHAGELIESRLATAADEHFQPLAGRSSLSASRRGSPSAPQPQESSSANGPSRSQPTSMSYSHPYLLVTHPDNTLTLYLVKSTSSALTISAGTRLWGHTSSVSGAHVGMRGKAVSVSRLGDELRLWDLEGGFSSSSSSTASSAAARKRTSNADLSVRVQPSRAATAADSASAAAAEEEELERTSPDSYADGLKFALAHRFDEQVVNRGWVGFDEQNVIVLREKRGGGQALVVYDFA